MGKKRRHHIAKIQVRQDMALDDRETKLKAKGVLKLPSYGDERERAALSRTERAAMVEKVLPVLADWTSSPFQHEASCVHGIRRGLTMQGVRWEPAQLAATVTVEAALSRLNVKRPTWAEGQPEYRFAYDTCFHCGAELDEEQITRGERFCSAACAARRREDMARHHVRCEDQIVQSAYRMLDLARRPEQVCECCGKSFVPRGNGGPQKYCSQRCNGLMKTTMPEAVCINPGCGKPFRIRNSGAIESQQWCCGKCYYEHRRKDPAFFERDHVCTLCAKPFRSAASTALYCSDACNRQAWRFRQGKVPRRLNVKVFEFFFTIPANSSARMAA